MNIDKYLQELWQIKDALLQSKIECVSIRGENLASFIYAEAQSRAVEISKDGGGEWWLEFWDDSEDEDAPPVKDEFLEDGSQVFGKVLHWLYQVHDAKQEKQSLAFSETIQLTSAG